MSISHQSQCKIDGALINAAAQISRHLNVTPLNIFTLEVQEHGNEEELFGDGTQHYFN